MIKLWTDDAKVARDGESWVVKHPTHDTLLASCDTRQEAILAREALNDVARHLREVGVEVR